MLVLFDVDGTLLLTHGAGVAAMVDAGRELFGEQFTMEGMNVAGCLDALIWADAAAMNNIDNHAARHDEFRAAYGRHLERRLRTVRPATALPGVPALVEHLHYDDDIMLGVLTGNYPETGRLKIRSAGLDPEQFIINLWGIDGEHRRDLPRLAMQRYRERNGNERFSSEQVVIIGDTPHDIDCAHHNACRCIAVLTGRYSREEMAAHNPDVIFDDLSDTAAVVEVIGNLGMRG